MIKKLLAFGCSNTFGSECVQDGDHTHPDNVNHCYPKFLADMLGCKQYHNYAYPGKSNGDIAMQVYQYVDYHLNLNPDLAHELFVVIGWTEANRFPFWFNIEGYALQEQIITEYIALGIFNKEVFKNFNHKEPKIIQQTKDIISKYPFADQFVRGAMLYLFNTPSLIMYNLLIKAGVSNFLEKHKIKFITLPTLPSSSINVNLDHLGDRDPHVQEQLLLAGKHNILEFKHAEYPNQDGMGDWSYNFNMFATFGKYGVSKVEGHLKPVAHHKLAEYLHNEMKQRGII